MSLEQDAGLHRDHRYEPGVTQLGNFRPPAPQEWQMRSAQLHQFAGAPLRLWHLRRNHPTTVFFRTLSLRCLRLHT